MRRVQPPLSHSELHGEGPPQSTQVSRMMGRQFASVQGALRCWALADLYRHTLPPPPLPPGRSGNLKILLTPHMAGQLFPTPFSLCAHDPLGSTQQNRVEICCLQFCLPHSSTNPMRWGWATCCSLLNSQCLARCSLNIVDTLGPEGPGSNLGSVVFWLCDPGRVTKRLCASLFSFAK